METLPRTVLPFQSKPHFPTGCWLDFVYFDRLWYVVFSQDPDHMGTSVTNGIEAAIAAYHRLADLYNWPEPVDLQYVEHYRDGRMEFDLVTLVCKERVPIWQPAEEHVCWALASALGELDAIWLLAEP